MSSSTARQRRRGWPFLFSRRGRCVLLLAHDLAFLVDRPVRVAVEALFIRVTRARACRDWCRAHTTREAGHAHRMEGARGGCWLWFPHAALHVRDTGEGRGACARATPTRCAVTRPLRAAARAAALLRGARPRARASRAGRPQERLTVLREDGEPARDHRQDFSKARKGQRERGARDAPTRRVPPDRTCFSS